MLVSSPMVGSMSSPVQGQGPGMVSYEDWIKRDKDVDNLDIESSYTITSSWTLHAKHECFSTGNDARQHATATATTKYTVTYGQCQQTNTFSNVSTGNKR